jgi:hypothetical protein
MNENYNANQLYENYVQLGGGGMEAVVAPDGKTALRSFSYMPKPSSVGLGERIGSVFVDPYSGELRGTGITVGAGSAGAYGLHRRQLSNLTEEAKKIIKADARNVKQGGLSSDAWKKKYGKVTKKSILAQADELAKKNAKKATTFSKAVGKGSKWGKAALPYTAGISAGGAIGGALGSELAGQAVGGLGTWQVMKKLKDPKVMKKFMAYATKKLGPKVATKLGLSAAGIALPEGISTAVGLGGLAWTIHDILNAVGGDPELEQVLTP